MFKISKYFTVIATVLVGLFSSCSDRFLDTELTGGTVSQEQYENNPNSLTAHVNGLYSLMRAYGGGHDLFGQRSIDIKTDMMCADMAMLTGNYGWFVVDAQMMQAGYSQLGSYLWSYYYRIIKNANKILQTKKVEYLDEAPTNVEEQIKANLYGQALAMRGWAYYNLAVYFGTNQVGGTSSTDILGKDCVPVYYEFDSEDEAKPLEKADYVLKAADRDLNKAMAYMQYYENNTAAYKRIHKTGIDSDIARVILAYSKMYRASKSIAFDVSNICDTVILLCQEVIDRGRYKILPLNRVLETGFNSVSNEDWMWAQDVTIETAGGLASFWGQVDIFTYSYAAAGATKAIDQTLWESIPSTDRRKPWFNTDFQVGRYRLAPTWKFYDKARILQGDRIWTNDDVFMRFSEVYLLAAEAAAYKQDVALAAQYLKSLVEQRDETVAPTLASMNLEQIVNQILFNWRVEMWGEGKSYFTMLRMFDYGIDLGINFNTNRTAGQNHRYIKNDVVSAYDFEKTILFIPSAELIRNPHIN